MDGPFLRRVGVGVAGLGSLAVFSIVVVADLVNLRHEHLFHLKCFGQNVNTKQRVVCEVLEAMFRACVV